MSYINHGDVKAGICVNGDCVVELLRHYPFLTAELVDRWRRQVERGEREIRVVDENGRRAISTTLITNKMV